MPDSTVLITGANRGIGLGLTRLFLSAGYQVLAAARNPDGARDLWELESEYKGRCRLLSLDVADPTSIKQLARELRGQRLDILINNAGVYPDAGLTFDRLTTDDFMKAFTVNTLGPIQVTQALLPNLRTGTPRVVAVVSSRMGSIADNTSGGAYAYRISKAAVDMFVKTLSNDEPDLIAVALHPGWVKTEMGGSAAPVEVDDATAGLYHVLTSLKPGDTGRFIDFTGKDIPW